MARTRKRKQRINVYFDTETFNSYEHLKYSDINKLSDIEKLPLVIPYLVGACTDEPNSFVHFEGLNASHQFLSWLFNTCSGCDATLYAFNVDFDFQAIKAYIRRVNPSAYVEYCMTGDKKFICGSIKDRSTKPQTMIQIRDLYVWDKSKGSLEANYANLRKIAQNDKKWADLLEQYGIKQLEKLKLHDYFKRDLHLNKEDNKLYYWDKNNILKQLDLEHEIKYLKMDVIGLPILRMYQKEFRQTCIDGLQLNEAVDFKQVARSYSVPSFGKILAQTYLKEEFSTLYRFPTTLEDYIHQDLSYIGGYTGNNKDIYVLEDCRHSDGRPKIECYDVNSMYPTIMQQHLPYGDVLNTPPHDSPYVTWYTIWFDRELPNGELYKFKPKYDQLNNSFFGNDFLLRRAEDKALNGVKVPRYYVEKSLLDMFLKVCDSYVVIDQEDIKYQRLTTKLTEFVNIIYDKKANAATQWERNAFKLLLNSLYGKMGERWHDDYWSWNSDEEVFERQINELDYRETILAGLYITSRSRVMLWEGIVTEIDNGNIILSVDTDSMKLIANNPVKIKIDDKQLGGWKYEGSATHFYHNGKLKRYFLFNADDPTSLKIAVSGFDKEVVSKLSREDLRTLYSPNNNTLFRSFKTVSKRNLQQQIVIFEADIEFNPLNHKPITHEYKEGKIIPYEA